MHHHKQNAAFSRSAAFQASPSDTSPHKFYFQEINRTYTNELQAGNSSHKKQRSDMEVANQRNPNENNNTPLKRSPIKLVKSSSPFTSASAAKQHHQGIHMASSLDQSNKSCSKSPNFAEIKKSQIVFADKDFKTGPTTTDYHQQAGQSKSPQESSNLIKPARNSSIHLTSPIPTISKNSSASYKQQTTSITQSTKALQLQSQKSVLLKQLTNMLHLSAAFDRELTSDTRFQIFKNPQQANQASQQSQISGDLSSISAQLVKNCILLKTRSDNLNQSDLKILDCDRQSNLHQLRRVALSLSLSPSRRQVLNELLDSINQPQTLDTIDIRGNIDEFFQTTTPQQVQSVLIERKKQGPPLCQENQKKVSPGAVQEARPLQLAQQTYPQEEDKREQSAQKAAQCHLKLTKNSSNQKLKQSTQQQMQNSQRSSQVQNSNLRNTNQAIKVNKNQQFIIENSPALTTTPTKGNSRYNSASKRVQQSFDPIMVTSSKAQQPQQDMSIAIDLIEPMTPPYYNVNTSSVRMTTTTGSTSNVKQQRKASASHQNTSDQTHKKGTTTTTSSASTQNQGPKTLNSINSNAMNSKEVKVQEFKFHNPQQIIDTKPKNSRKRTPLKSSQVQTTQANNENENPNPTSIIQQSAKDVHISVSLTQNNYNLSNKHEFTAKELPVKSKNIQSEQQQSIPMKSTQPIRTTDQVKDEEYQTANQVEKQKQTDQIKVNSSNFTNQRPNYEKQQQATAETQKLLLVLDMDETLLHFDHAKKVYYPRPYVNNFLQQMAPLYEMCVFTAGMKDYADWLLDDLDQQRFIKKRLYRDSCTIQRGVYYKDLRKLRHNLRKVIIVDNMPENFGLQPGNGIPIKGWYNESNQDCELLKLSNILQRIHYDFFEAEESQSSTGDVRNGITRYIPNCHANKVKRQAQNNSLATSSPQKQRSSMTYGMAVPQSAQKLRQQQQNQPQQQIMYLNSNTAPKKQTTSHTNVAQTILLNSNAQSNKFEEGQQLDSKSNSDGQNNIQYFNYPKQNNVTPKRERNQISSQEIFASGAVQRGHATSVKKSVNFSRVY